MKYSQIRIALLTFTLGVVSIPFFNALYDKWTEPYIELPKVESKAPIFVYEKYYRTEGGGGGSGGQTCDDFVESLGKLNKSKRLLIYESPCYKYFHEKEKLQKDLLKNARTP